MNQNSGCNLSNWMAEFQDGNSSAFSILYDSYVNILFNYGCKLTNDKELLKDCIHDVFVKIYMKRTELDSIENEISSECTSMNRIGQRSTTYA